MCAHCLHFTFAAAAVVALAATHRLLSLHWQRRRERAYRQRESERARAVNSEKGQIFQATSDLFALLTRLIGKLSHALSREKRSVNFPHTHAHTHVDITVYRLINKCNLPYVILQLFAILRDVTASNAASPSPSPSLIKVQFEYKAHR